MDLKSVEGLVSLKSTQIQALGSQYFDLNAEDAIDPEILSAAIENQEKDPENPASSLGYSFASNLDVSSMQVEYLESLMPGALKILGPKISKKQWESFDISIAKTLKSLNFPNLYAFVEEKEKNSKNFLQ